MPESPLLDESDQILLTHEVERIINELEKVLPSCLDTTTDVWRSRWNGTVEIEEIAFHRGVLRTDGSIGLLRPIYLARGAALARTLIHEALHSFSPLRTPRQYQEYIGWEEGVVEALQRLLRSQLLAGWKFYQCPTAEDFLPDDAIHPFNVYISILEELRVTTEIDSITFYVRLLHTPVEQRFDLVRSWRGEISEGARDILLMRSQGILRRQIYGF